MPLQEDIALMAGPRERWEALEGARIFVTGGTGFVGKWLASALVAANRVHGLEAKLVLLTRDPRAFSRTCPELAAAEGVSLVEGDVRAKVACEPCGFVIHGATPSDQWLNTRRPAEMLSVIEDGTRSVLRLAAEWDAGRFLLVSSGAVYAPPAPSAGFAEDSPLGPDWPEERSAYHAGKRRAERLALGAADAGLSVTVARLFAFVGPHLPLDRHFAVGNFLADALNGRSVSVHGDGSPIRSYLYAAEMAVWIWSMLTDDRAAGETFNVGSEEAVSIREVAAAVACAVDPAVPVTVLGEVSEGPRDVYLPDTGRASVRLGLRRSVDLAEGLRRTVAWHRGHPENGVRA